MTLDRTRMNTMESDTAGLRGWSNQELQELERRIKQVEVLTLGCSGLEQTAVVAKNAGEGGLTARLAAIVGAFEQLLTDTGKRKELSALLDAVEEYPAARLPRPERVAGRALLAAASAGALGRTVSGSCCCCCCYCCCCCACCSC